MSHIDNLNTVTSPSQRCRRLGLTALCYLWQRDQGELLSEMVDAGLEAILIKVAGVGLSTKHLGQTLAQMQTPLFKLVRMSRDAVKWFLIFYRTISMALMSAAKEGNTKPSHWTVLSSSGESICKTWSYAK